MEKLKSTSKITLATLKSFAKRNATSIFYKVTSDFDGMQDCVTSVKSDWKQSKICTSNYYVSGIHGIYTTGSSGNYFRLYEDTDYFGIEVSNCCGSSTLAVKKIK
jgi:hypothetical protein